MSIKVVGIATGSHNVEVWHFDKNDDLLKRFCEMLVRETGYNVIIIDGEVIGTYKTPPIPVEYIPFEDRFKQFAATKGLPSSYAGDYLDKQQNL